ncbi:hypothetical protein [[Kitasatospora] papulosa]|uniref:hypothetical protein n=1 Tax=[Kitasatospora] papulosa TaxID=1464011 RepID=UPI0036AF2994
MPPTPTNPTTRLRSAAQRALESLDDLIANTTDPGVEALGARYELARELSTTTGQPATAPWPPTGDQRPDHGLYTLLRRAGLTPEAAQQEIDTYTQTIRTQPAPAADRTTVLREAADAFRAMFGDVIVHGADGDWANVADWTATGARIPACGSFYPHHTDTRCVLHKGHRGSHRAPWGSRTMAWPYDRRETQPSSATTAEAQQPTPAETEATPDTLAPWLHQRFTPEGRAANWDSLSDDDQSYWEHHARAVRRAVARGGFKAPAVTEEPTP